jgi:hypothetical protein
MRCALRANGMGGYGGPAQPSPTIGQCLNGGGIGSRSNAMAVSRSNAMAVKTRASLPAGCHPPTAEHADLEA